MTLTSTVTTAPTLGLPQFLDIAAMQAAVAKRQFDTNGLSTGGSVATARGFGNSAPVKDAEEAARSFSVFRVAKNRFQFLQTNNRPHVEFPLDFAAGNVVLFGGDARTLNASESRFKLAAIALCGVTDLTKSEISEWLTTHQLKPEPPEVVKAPDWLVARMQTLHRKPAPSYERMVTQFRASEEHRKKSTSKQTS